MTQKTYRRIAYLSVHAWTFNAIFGLLTADYALLGRSLLIIAVVIKGYHWSLEPDSRVIQIRISRFWFPWIIAIAGMFLTVYGFMLWSAL